MATSRVIPAEAATGRRGQSESKVAAVRTMLFGHLWQVCCGESPAPEAGPSLVVAKPGPRRAPSAGVREIEQHTVPRRLFAADFTDTRGPAEVVTHQLASRRHVHTARTGAGLKSCKSTTEPASHHTRSPHSHHIPLLASSAVH